MSVLMRGVDMPKNCEECNFKGECRNYWAKIREAYTRPSWCPLVEVADRKTEPIQIIIPKNHGRKQAFAMIDEFYTMADRKTEPMTVTYNPTSVNNIWEKPTNPYIPNEQTEPQTERSE